MSDWVCAISGDHRATFFCSCDKSLIKLCKEDEKKHQESTGAVYHVLYPIEALQDFQNPAYLENLGKRNAVKDVALAELQRNDALVEDCCEQLQREVDKLTRRLTAYANARLKELRDFQTALRRDISECVQEVESTHYLENVEIKGRLAEVVRNYKLGKKQLVLFRFQVDTQQWPFDVEHILQYEILGPRTDVSTYRPFATYINPEAEKQGLLLEKQQLQASLAHSLKQIEALNIEKAAMLGNYERQIAQLRNQVQSESASKQELVEKVRSLNSELTAASKSVSTLQQSMLSANKEVAKWQEDSKSKADELKKLKAEVMQLCEKSSQSANQVDKLKKQIADSNCKHEVKEASLNCTIAHLRKELQVVNGSNVDLSLKVSQLSEEVKNLQRKISEKEEIIRTLEAEVVRIREGNPEELRRHKKKLIREQLEREARIQ